MQLDIHNMSNTIIKNDKYFVSDSRKIDSDTWTNCDLNGLNQFKLIQSFSKYDWNSLRGCLSLKDKMKSSRKLEEESFFFFL